MQKIYPALRDHGVCSVAMLADLEPSDTYSLGITAFQLKSLQKLVLEVDKKVDEKPFATTRVIIDGRGCLIGKGMNFSVTVFKKRLDGMLLKAGARAKHVSNIFTFLSMIISNSSSSFTYETHLSTFFDGRPNWSAWRTSSRSPTRTTQSTTRTTQGPL